MLIQHKLCYISKHFGAKSQTAIGVPRGDRFGSAGGQILESALLLKSQNGSSTVSLRYHTCFFLEHTEEMNKFQPAMLRSIFSVTNLPPLIVGGILENKEIQ